MFENRLIISFFVIRGVFCLNGVLWNKKLEQFIPIFDVPSFQRVQVQLLAQSYELEAHNFNKQPIRLLFHQEQGMITSYNHNKRINGFFGEIYSFLSEYANFTLDLKSVPEKRAGLRPTLTSGYDGLLRYIEQNSSDVIAKIEIFPYWLDVVDFLLPLWNDRFRLFVQSSHQDNALWIANLFEYDVWMALLVIYILFISISIYTKSNISRPKLNKYSLDCCSEYVLYYHGIFSQRSFYLLQMQKTSRILNSCACLFSMLTFAFYSAKILYSMVNKIPFQPFNSIATLHHKTDYMVIAEKDSIIQLSYEFLLIYTDFNPKHPLRPLIRSKRIKFLPSRDVMYSVACTSKKHYAMLESEYLKQNIEKYGCEFVSMGESYYHTWIGGGTRKNFTYKRTFDRGILKLFESGILSRLKKRLIGLKKIQLQNSFEPIDLKKINTILAIFVVGIAASILLLIIEEICYCLKFGKGLKKMRVQLESIHVNK